ncbi:MAG: isoprenylcysteine carboxylmethyltransferase family protein [Candidatus Atribacteria bacterium]|nr:isoprenylcysteine carboxylmethyltransferase family protein [Candidatus Atribacteria bacterium]
MVRLTIFLILSIFLIIWSRKSLKNRKVHGFYRFFAFESILALIIVNSVNWFTNPFSVIQIISWILLLVSIVIATQGFYLLHKIGKPEKEIEETSILVKTGIYKCIRHPLYSSLILLAWGSFLKDISLLPAGLAIAATIFLVVTAIVEEKENLQRFGDEYTHYMNFTKRFIPFIV